jgi:hypothetical protein
MLIVGGKVPIPIPEEVFLEELLLIFQQKLRTFFVSKRDKPTGTLIYQAGIFGVLGELA